MNRGGEGKRNFSVEYNKHYEDFVFDKLMLDQLSAVRKSMGDVENKKIGR